MIKLRRSQGFNSFICHTATLQLLEKSVQISSGLLNYLCLHTFLSVYKIFYGLLTLADMPVSVSQITCFQIFRIIKFPWWIFVFHVHVVSSVKYQRQVTSLRRMRAVKRFLFVVLVAMILTFFTPLMTVSMPVSMETVHLAKSRPRKNQSEGSDLPQDYLAI